MLSIAALAVSCVCAVLGQELADDHGDIKYGPPCHARSFTAISENGNFPASACSPVFYSCGGTDLSIERTCPPNTVFDVDSDDCLERRYVGSCPGGRPTVKPITTTGVPVTLPPFPFDCTLRRSGDYAHPNQPCSHLYASCAAGRLIVRQCNDDLYFDAVSSRCLSSEYVKTCGGRSTIPVETTTVPADEIPGDVVCAPSRVYFLENPINRCSRVYYSCSYGVARRLECPRGLRFDLLGEECLQSEYVPVCGGRRTTTTTAAPGPDTPVVNFNCVGLPDGNYPSGACQAVYFTCSNGAASRFQCPANLRFSVQENECLSRTLVESCPESGLPGPICESKVDGFYAVNCDQYVFCQHQEPFLLNCRAAQGSGLVVHPTRGICLPIDEVPAPCGTKPEADEFVCDGLEIGYYTSDDCNRYYYCEEDGSAWQFDCSVGYAFDISINECRPQVNVPVCRPPPANLDRFCRVRGNGLHAHPTDCHFGVVCLSGVSFELPCPTEELPRFDPDTRQCAAATEQCQAIGLTEDDVSIGQAGDVPVESDGSPQVVAVRRTSALVIG